MEHKIVNKSNYDFLGKSIPFITIYIIILGLVTQLLYYTNFNVPIKYFLSITELGLIISDELLIFSFVALLYLFMTFYLIPNSKEELLDNKVNKKEPNGKLIIFLSVIMVLILIIAIIFSPDYYHKVRFFSLLITVFPTFILILLKDYFPSVQTKTIIIFFFLLSTLLIYNISVKIPQVQNGKYTGTKIYTADSIYISSDSSYFIGKTEKYVFIYNSKDSTTSILPSESVTKIVMKSK